MSLRLGIDLGGTSAKIALVGPRSTILKEKSVPSSGHPDPHVLVNKVARAARRLFNGKTLARAGVGVAGDIDFARGVVRVSPNLGWRNVPLKALLQRQLPCPVVVDNDANAAAWGLYKTQAPAGVKHLVAVTLGTGVGGGVVMNGQLHRGATGSAGEIGHMNVSENGPRCQCGMRGCLEAYVGGPYLVKKARGALARGQTSRLQKLFRLDPDEITPYEIARAANRGDRYARSLWDDVGRVLGLVLGDIVYVLNPEIIFLTGGVAQAGSLILKPLLATLKRRAFKAPVNAVRVKIAQEAAHIGVIGASLL